jgi:cytochrome P460
MTQRRPLAVGLALAIALTGALATRGSAGPDKIQFPSAWKDHVLYTTVDRYDNKQYRELYASSQAAVDAMKAGKPLPDGTVLTMVQYAAQVDDKGVPVKGPNGRFVRTDKIVGYTVMEKRPGWGKDVPEDIRNGDWQYQAFLADRTPNPKAVLANCFKCHKPLDKQDFVFSWEGLRTVTK